MLPLNMHLLEDIANIPRSPRRNQGQTKRNFSLRMTERQDLHILGI